MGEGYELEVMIVSRCVVRWPERVTAHALQSSAWGLEVLDNKGGSSFKVDTGMKMLARSYISWLYANFARLLDWSSCFTIVNEYSYFSKRAPFPHLQPSLLWSCCPFSGETHRSSSWKVTHNSHLHRSVVSATVTQSCVYTTCCSIRRASETFCGHIRTHTRQADGKGTDGRRDADVFDGIQSTSLLILIRLFSASRKSSGSPTTSVFSLIIWVVDNVLRDPMLKWKRSLFSWCSSSVFRGRWLRIRQRVSSTKGRLNLRRRHTRN